MLEGPRIQQFINRLKEPSIEREIYRLLLASPKR